MYQVLIQRLLTVFSRKFLYRLAQLTVDTLLGLSNPVICSGFFCITNRCGEVIQLRRLDTDIQATLEARGRCKARKVRSWLLQYPPTDQRERKKPMRPPRLLTWAIPMEQCLTCQVVLH